MRVPRDAEAPEGAGRHRAVDELVDDQVRGGVGREGKVPEGGGPQLADLVEVDVAPVEALGARVHEVGAAERVVAAAAVGGTWGWRGHRWVIATLKKFN